MSKKFSYLEVYRHESIFKYYPQYEWYDQTPVVEICKKMGIKVFRADRDIDFRLEINFKSNQEQEIIVNKNHDGLRQRFYIAKAICYRLRNKKAHLIETSESPLVEDAQDNHALDCLAVATLLPLKRLEFFVKRITGADVSAISQLTGTPGNATGAALADYQVWAGLDKLLKAPVRRSTRKEFNFLGHAVELGVGAAIGSMIPSIF